MNIAIYQFAPAFGDAERNLQKIEQRLQDIEADLVVLPELCTTGYFFASREQVQSMAEPVPGGETVRRLETLCQWKGLHLVAGIAESAEGTCYNSAVLIGPDGWIGTYRKIHLFWKEKIGFAPGNRPFQVWNIGKARVGLMVCFDWIFPESARSLALQGADIICHPANLVLPHCPDAMVTRSIENRVYTVTANRIGFEEREGKKLNFIGKSQITGVKGEILLRMGQEEGLKQIEIDPALARNKKITEANDLFQDRKPDLYLNQGQIPSRPPEAASIKKDVNPIFHPDKTD